MELLSLDLPAISMSSLRHDILEPRHQLPKPAVPNITIAANVVDKSTNDKTTIPVNGDDAECTSSKSFGELSSRRISHFQIEGKNLVRAIYSG